MTKANQATLISGANEVDVDLPVDEQMTLAELIAKYKTVANVPEGEGAEVRVNGEPANSEQTIRSGDEVEVIRRAGVKG